MRAAFESKRAVVLPFLLAALLSCSDDGGKKNTDGGGGGDGSSSEKGSKPKLKWVLTIVDSNRGGTETALARNGSNYGLAYYRSLADSVQITCPGATGTKPKQAFDLYYVAGDSSGWGTPVKIDESVGNTFGVSIAIDSSSGKTYVGYIGGELSVSECLSGDAVIASSTDGKTFTKTTLASAGSTGDSVGYWTSVALTSKGEVHGAYGDFLFGYYEQEGKQKAATMYDSAVVAKNGSGVYNNLRFDASDNPVIAYVNAVQKTSEGGIQVAVKKSGVWTSTQIAAVITSSNISLGTDGAGVFGLAYFEPSSATLKYAESKDSFANTTAVKVDDDLTHNGEYASLAYDSKGNPGISYYRCSAAGASKCDNSADALMYAYRKSGNWSTYEVDQGGTNRCGTYTSLVYDSDDMPVISYQCVVFDNQTNTYIDNLKVAQGVVQ
jgi:hypothetical protein